MLEMLKMYRRNYSLKTHTHTYIYKVVRVGGWLAQNIGRNEAKVGRELGWRVVCKKKRVERA